MNFNDLVNRSQLLNEGKGRPSPYKKFGDVFSGIANRFEVAGFPAPTRDARLYIADTLTDLKVFSIAERESIEKAAKGSKSPITARRKALLALLDKKEEEITSRKAEIEQALNDGLDRDQRFKATNRGAAVDSSGPTTGRTDKYNARAAARALAKQQGKSSEAPADPGYSKEKVDAHYEKLVVRGLAARVIRNIKDNLGDEGVDIDERALTEVADYVATKIFTLDGLMEFIRQIAREPGYELIATYLKDVVKPARQEISSGKFEDEEYDASKADVDKDGTTEPWEKGLAKKRGFTESTTASYLTEQVKKDKYNKASNEASLSFTEKYKPKTSWQLQELRNYGL
jgi:hypothetical protein